MQKNAIALIGMSCAAFIGNSAVVWAVCCDNRVPWNSYCRDSEEVGTCEDMPIDDCPVVSSCEGVTRNYYLDDPKHECKENITTHTLCLVWENRELCYLIHKCEKVEVNGVLVCVHNAFPTDCHEEWVFEAEMEDCVDCPGS